MPFLLSYYLSHSFTFYINCFKTFILNCSGHLVKLEKPTIANYLYEDYSIDNEFIVMHYLDG